MSRIHRMLGPLVGTIGIIAATLAVTHAQAPGPGTSRQGVVWPGRNIAPARITQADVEAVEARVAAATALIDRFERDAKAEGRAEGWRQATLESLLPLSLEALHRVAQQAFSLDALAAATREAAGDADLLGQGNRDLVFTPIVPCRFIDTRQAGGKIAGVRGFDIDNPGSAYGGAGACDPAAILGLLPRNSDQIAALAMNVTLVDTSTAGAPGVVAIKPTAMAPASSLLNWHQQGVGVQVANQGVVSLDQGGGSGDVDEFVIQTSGPVHVVVDLFGAFIRPQATALETIHLFNSILVPNLAATGVESPVCPAGYRLTGGGCFTTHYGHLLSISYPGGGDNRWACRAHNTTGVDSELYARAICARIPGR